MTEKERDILLKDLCARLPYGVKIKYLPDNRLDGIVLPYLHNGLTVLQKGNISYRANVKYIRPYLRPMSSMTEEEYKEYRGWVDAVHNDPAIQSDGYFDWLNSHYFDYRGLIKKGLALKAPEGMYNNLKQ